jgi:predicted DNA-binding antitoxin AbrB/MazE fold protein
MNMRHGTFASIILPTTLAEKARRFLVSQHLKAVYEDGVFRPLEPVQLPEHQEVTLVLETAGSAGGRSAEKPIWEVAADLVRDLPEDALSGLPTDAAAQHDHYLYGTPKRD